MKVKTILTSFLVLLALFTFGCSSPVSVSTAKTPTPSDNSSFVVNVSANTPLASNRSVSLLSDSNVASVQVTVTQNGTTVGGGTLTKTTTGYSGSISLSQSGIETFTVVALNTIGIELWVGSAIENISTSGVSIAVASRDNFSAFLALLSHNSCARGARIPRTA